MTSGEAPRGGPGERPAPRAPMESAGCGRPARARHVARPAAAEQQLITAIAAGRRARMRRALILAMASMSAFVLLASGSGWVLARYVSGHLTRLDAGTSGTTNSGPLNILVAGVDIRSGLTWRQQVLLHVGHVTSHNSDTLIVVHVFADHRHIDAVSLPRDSWVEIPGHGMNKINAAIGLGGPKLMVRTVQAATGLRINDYVQVNFLAFVKVIDALGGVNICLPYAVDDPYSGLHLAAGRHHVNGITALQFARDRHSFARSDLARISDQQQLLASVMTEAVRSGAPTDPVRFGRLLAAATAAIRVDQRFNLVSLARQLRYLRPRAVAFFTVPLANTGYLTPGGESAVLWDRQAARTMFARIASDRPAPRRPGRTRRAAGQGHPAKTAAQAACR